jgi:hypothetical protein
MATLPLQANHMKFPTVPCKHLDTYPDTDLGSEV